MLSGTARASVRCRTIHPVPHHPMLGTPIIVAALQLLTASAPFERTSSLMATRAYASSARITREYVRVIEQRSDSADVARVVESFHAALAAGDREAAMRLLAPDAIIQESGGVETRADYEGHHLPGDIEFARAVPSTRGPITVTIVGDAAWTSGTSVTKGTFRTRAINSVGAELMVLSRTNGAWRIRAIHWSSRTPR